MAERMVMPGRPRRRQRVTALIAIAILALGGYALFVRGHRAAPAQEHVEAPPGPLESTSTAPLAGGGTEPSPLAVRLNQAGDVMRGDFKHPPRSALLFDLDTGRVLWPRDPPRGPPLASPAEVMTAPGVAG